MPKKIREKDKVNVVYNADSRKIAGYLGSDIRITTTITSPPYYDMKDYGSDNQIGYGQDYESYLNDLKLIFQDILGITKENGSLWIIIDTFKKNSQVVTLPFDLANKLKEVGWLLQDIIIWKKDKTVPWSTKGFMQRKFEYILFFTKSNRFKYNKDRVRNFDTNQLKRWWVKYPERYNPKGKALDEIWEFPIPVQGSWGDEYVRHFCPLPKEMVATMLEISSDIDDIVLDPFAGSGAVIFQAAVMDRKYLGFELNPEYISMFEVYTVESFAKQKREYERLSSISAQNDFEKQILDLRALKFGRLLANHLEENSGNNVQVYVEILDRISEKKKHIRVLYRVIGMDKSDSLIRIVEEVITKRPFSKFGIVPVFEFAEKISRNPSKNYYGYTKTNSYSYSELDLSSAKIKVVSNICVNLDEKDYE